MNRTFAPTDGGNSLPTSVAVSPGAVRSLLAAAATTGPSPAVQPLMQKWSVLAYGSTSSGTGSATVQVQGSHDGLVWVNLGSALSLTLGTVTTAAAYDSNGVYPLVRANVTALTGIGANVTATLAE